MSDKEVKAETGGPQTPREMAIRGTCPHGKVLFLCSDDPRFLDRKVKNEIGRMVAAGFSMDRVTPEEARKKFDAGCDDCTAARRLKR